MITTAALKRTVARIATFCAAFLVVGAPAIAQTFEKVEGGRVRETIPAGPFLAGAYGFIWAAVIVYVVIIARRLARVQAELEDMRRRVERANPH